MKKGQCFAKFERKNAVIFASWRNVKSREIVLGRNINLPHCFLCVGLRRHLIDPAVSFCVSLWGEYRVFCSLSTCCNQPGFCPGRARFGCSRQTYMDKTSIVKVHLQKTQIKKLNTNNCEEIVYQMYKY